jgi:hypothetical protein
MRGFILRCAVYAAVALGLLATVGSCRPVLADDHSTFVIVFKDGHRQSLATSEVEKIDLKAPASILYRDGHREKIAAEVERIEFGDPGMSSLPGRSHFIGKWEVGEGNGGRFFVTLEANGDAKKTLGSSHGTWALVDGQARITWSDGWHDIIRKVGGKHEKVAFEPGKTFDDTPSNVTWAKNTEPKPI